MRIALSVSEKEKNKGTQSPYFQALLAGGATAEELVLLSATQNQVALTSPAGLPGSDDPLPFDGILFCGGADIDPQLYGEWPRYENVQVERVRDDFELGLLKKARRQGLPVLCICRGIQMLNVACGGSLYQDLQLDGATPRQHRQTDDGFSRQAETHAVELLGEDSLLARLLASRLCQVNSLHHQGIKILGEGLKVVACSEEGLIEAVEASDDYPFLLAVQWHPEELLHRRDQRRICEEFVEACRRR